MVGDRTMGGDVGFGAIKSPNGGHPDSGYFGKVVKKEVEMTITRLGPANKMDTNHSFQPW